MVTKQHVIYTKNIIDKGIFMNKLWKKLLVTSTLLAFTLPSLAIAEVDFNYQSLYTPAHTFIINIGKPWEKELPEKSNGVLKPYVFTSSSLVAQNEAVSAIMDGSLDMGSISPVFSLDVLPLTAFINIPFGSDDAIHSTEMLYEIYATNPEIKKELDTPGHLLNMWGADKFGFFSKTGPITSVEDIKGKRVLIWNGQLVEQIKAWGGVPVQVAPNDTYIALERGMGDILFAPLPSGVANKFMEVAKDITPVPASSFIIFTWASNDFWNYLSDEEKAIITKTTEPWGRKTAQLLVESTAKDIETMKANGCTFYELSPEEMNKFKELAIPPFVEYLRREFDRLGIDKDPQEWVDYVYSVSEKVRNNQ